MNYIDINKLSEAEKQTALNGFAELMKQYEVMRKITSDIVYELKRRYENEDETEKLCTDVLTQYIKNCGKKHNYVYFFRNKYNNLVKIGCTTDIVKRYGDIRSICKNYIGMEDALTIEGAIDTSFIKPERVEKFLHEKYKKYRKFGEWFEFTDNVWKEIYHLFIEGDDFAEMINDDDVEKLDIQDKVHNIMYVGSPNDKEFVKLLSECSKTKAIEDNLVETYIDKLTNMISGVHFDVKFFDENEPFYRLLYMDFADRFVERKFDISMYTFNHMKNYYDTLASANQ